MKWQMFSYLPDIYLRVSIARLRSGISLRLGMVLTADFQSSCISSGDHAGGDSRAAQ